MNDEKRLSRKSHAAKVFCVLQRKFPREVEAAMKDMKLEEVAAEVVAAANSAAFQGILSSFIFNRLP